MLSGFRYRGLRQIPHRTALIAPFAVLTVLAMGLAGYLSFRNGQEAVGDVADQLRSQIALHITEHVKGFLETPHKINQINADAIRQGVLDATDPKALNDNFREQIGIFRSVTSIYFGNAKGGLVNCGREGVTDSRYVILTDRFQSGKLEKYATDELGNSAALLATVADYDARTRPWYTGAVKTGTAVWSPIYRLSTGQDMAVAASRPVYDDRRNLLGVVSVDLFLSHLSGFLRSLEIGKTGQAFIMERSGLLIASSTDEELFAESVGDKTQQRSYAFTSAAPLIRHAAETMNAGFINYDTITGPRQLEFKMDGKRQFLHVTPVKDLYGIDWLIAVVIPEADYMARIHANNRVTASLFVVFFALIIAAGSLVSRWITRPLVQLCNSARDIAEGRWAPSACHDSPIKEIADLSASFNTMTGQLKQTLESNSFELAERMRTQEVLRENEDRLELVLRGARLGAWDWNIQTGHIVFNALWAQMRGYEPEEIEPNIGAWEKMVHPQDMPYVTEALNAHLDGKTHFYESEYRLRTKDGGWIWVLDKGKVLRRDDQGRPLRASGTHMDISQRKLADEALRTALQEKEILLREIHHRVKNNMQVISSLLNLQAGQQENEQVRRALVDSQQHIKAMAMVHEALFNSQNIATIDLSDYLKNLVRHLQGIYGSQADVRISTVPDKIELNIDQAVPCGLIANELLTNAFKHAFRDGNKGVIRIKVQRVNGKEMVLEISDNGAGLPPGLDIGNLSSFGLRLVQGLLEHQLQGSLHVDTGEGAAFTLRWPLPDKKGEHA